MSTHQEVFWIVIGDLHGSIKNIHKIPEVNKAAAVIISGDITNAGRKEAAEGILKEILELNLNIYAQIGNMDYPEVNMLLEEKGCNIHARGLELNSNTALIGVGYSNITPFSTPSEVSDTKLSTWLDQAYRQVELMQYKILISHTPPFNTKTDQINGGAHVGSQAIRDFIEKKEPDISIVGHIHEAIGEDFLGQSKLLNPGMFSTGHYVLITNTEHGPQASLKKINI